MAELVNVRNLGRHPEGYWIAEVSSGASHWHPVDRKFGSWRTPSAVAGRWCDVLTPVAAELQRQVKKLEKREALHEAKIGASPVEADELRSEMETA